MRCNKVTLSKLIIVCLTLALSCAAGLAVSARAEMTIYVPLVTANRNKVGIAPGGYVTGDLELLNAAWSYRWNNEIYGDRVEWVDMIWGERYMSVSIRSNIILGFNEPDRTGQANIDPLTAAQLWREIEMRYPGKRLISPAPSQTDPGWLWRMVDDYTALYGEKPRFDGVAVHYYRWSESMSTASEYLQQRRADELAHGYDAPLWLTEVGACGADEVATLRDVMQAANELGYLARAAWYKLRADQWDTATCSTMIDERGALTPLGRAYQDEVTAWR